MLFGFPELVETLITRNTCNSNVVRRVTKMRRGTSVSFYGKDPSKVWFLTRLKSQVVHSAGYAVIHLHGGLHQKERQRIQDV